MPDLLTSKRRERLERLLSHSVWGWAEPLLLLAGIASIMFAGYKVGEYVNANADRAKAETAQLQHDCACPRPTPPPQSTSANVTAGVDARVQ